MFKKVLSFLQGKSVKDLFKATSNYIYPHKAKSFKTCKNLIQNKSGLEIGGPSGLFSRKGLLPVYPYIKSLDNCTFSSQTIWEGQIKAGRYFKYDENAESGYQYILDSTKLNEIPDAKYDFVLSSHVIEHIANPVKALFEWVRVLKYDGIVILVLPHKDGTFDHRRKITDLSHIIDDYNNNVAEDDLTHLDEILQLHDLSKDILAGTFNQFKERSLKNLENRCLHHHVFNTYSAIKLIDYIKLKILYVEAIFPYHIIIIARKSDNYDNEVLINGLEYNNIKSPFKSDNIKNG